MSDVGSMRSAMWGTYILPVARFDVQLDEHLLVANLGVDFGGVSILLHLFEEVSRSQQRLTLRLVQLASDVNHPEEYDT